MTGRLPRQTTDKIKAIIRDATAFTGTADTALVAMLAPGHGIPLTHTCGAVLDHDMIRLQSFCLGWDRVTGQVRSEDGPEQPLTVSVPLRDIVWMSPEIKAVV